MGTLLKDKAAPYTIKGICFGNSIEERTLVYMARRMSIILAFASEGHYQLMTQNVKIAYLVQV